MSNPYYRNPPSYQNSRQQLQNNQYQQELPQSYPQNHIGSGHNHRRSPESGSVSQVPRQLTPQQEFDNSYPDTVRTQQLSLNTHSQKHQQPYGSSFAYQQHQQETPQHQHPFQENSSHYNRRPAIGPVSPPSEHPQHHHIMNSQQLPQAAITPHNQQKTTTAMPSSIPRHRDRAPSPSYSVHSVHSNHSSDVPAAAAINRSRSPSGFYQPVSSPAVPLHSRQGSNSSLASNSSNTSRALHPPYQTQQQPQSHLSLLNSLPPPPPNLNTSRGSTDSRYASYSPSVPQHNHLSPTGASSQNFRYVDDIDPPPPPLPPPYKDEAAFFSPPHSPSRLGGEASPPLTPPTPPMVITGDFEDEFTRVSFVYLFPYFLFYSVLLSLCFGFYLFPFGMMHALSHA